MYITPPWVRSGGWDVHPICMATITRSDTPACFRATRSAVVRANRLPVTSIWVTMTSSASPARARVVTSAIVILAGPSTYPRAPATSTSPVAAGQACSHAAALTVGRGSGATSHRSMVTTWAAGSRGSGNSDSTAKYCGSRYRGLGKVISTARTFSGFVAPVSPAGLYRPAIRLPSSSPSSAPPSSFAAASRTLLTIRHPSTTRYDRANGLSVSALCSLPTSARTFVSSTAFSSNSSPSRTTSAPVSTPTSPPSRAG